MMEVGNIQEASTIGGLIGVQFVYAGNAVVQSYLMSLGLHPLTIVIFYSFATFIVLFPFAFYFERNFWPQKFRFKLVIQLFVISLGGVTLFQLFFLKGLKLTSPAMGTAMPNLAPGFIFIIAWIFGLEKVNLSCHYSKVKVLGTLLCVVGAVTMSLMQSTILTEKDAQLSMEVPSFLVDKHKIFGSLYLVVSVVILSSMIVLQATTLAEFPAPMSLCAITSLIGVFTTAAIQLFRGHKFEPGWYLLSLRDLIGLSLLAGSVSGACVSFNGWALKKKGPVFISMFSPLGTVCSVVLSSMTLGETPSTGSLAGMILMFTGLYFVLWAKGKEEYTYPRSLESEFDLEKPLLRQQCDSISCFGCSS